MVRRCISCWTHPVLGDMLVFRGVYGDYFINHEIRDPVIKQPGGLFLWLIWVLLHSWDKIFMDQLFELSCVKHENDPLLHVYIGMILRYDTLHVHIHVYIYIFWYYNNLATTYIIFTIEFNHLCLWRSTFRCIYIYEAYDNYQGAITWESDLAMQVQATETITNDLTWLQMAV